MAENSSESDFNDDWHALKIKRRANSATKIHRESITKVRSEYNGKAKHCRDDERWQTSNGSRSSVEWSDVDFASDVVCGTGGVAYSAQLSATKQRAVHTKNLAQM